MALDFCRSSWCSCASCRYIEPTAATQLSNCADSSQVGLAVVLTSFTLGLLYYNDYYAGNHCNKKLSGSLAEQRANAEFCKGYRRFAVELAFAFVASLAIGVGTAVLSLCMSFRLPAPPAGLPIMDCLVAVMFFAIGWVRCRPCQTRRSKCKLADMLRIVASHGRSSEAVL